MDLRGIAVGKDHNLCSYGLGDETNYYGPRAWHSFENSKNIYDAISDSYRQRRSILCDRIAVVFQWSLDS